VVVLVAEAHRSQLLQASARAAHVADVTLVAGRGGGDAELTGAADHDVGPADGRAADAGNIGRDLCAVVADANSIGFIRSAGAADVDIVAAGYEVIVGGPAEPVVIRMRGNAASRSRARPPEPIGRLTTGLEGSARGRLTFQHHRIKPRACYLLPNPDLRPMAVKPGSAMLDCRKTPEFVGAPCAT